MAEPTVSSRPLLMRRKLSHRETEQVARGHTRLGSGQAELTGADLRMHTLPYTSRHSWGPVSLGNSQRPLLSNLLFCARTLTYKLVLLPCWVFGLKRVGEKWQSGKSAWLSPLLSLHPTSKLQILYKIPMAFKKSLGFKHTKVEQEYILVSKFKMPPPQVLPFEDQDGGHRQVIRHSWKVGYFLKSWVNFQSGCHKSGPEVFPVRLWVHTPGRAHARRELKVAAEMCVCSL